MPVYNRYVALGDSFTEGVGDHDPALPNGVRGWADRVAGVLAAHRPAFGYANLAIRGRKMQAVLDEQIAPAVALSPDLVTIYAGGNDILRPKVDLDALVSAYGEGVARLRTTGAHLVLWTAFDPGHAPVLRHLRGRFATYNELVREVAEANDATLIDFWRMRDYRNPRLWAEDRIHMSSAGHQQMAITVLDALGIEHELEPIWSLGPLGHPRPGRATPRRQHLDWARAHAAPWIHRRIRGVSSGDGLSPRYPELTRPHVG